MPRLTPFQKRRALRERLWPSEELDVWPHPEGEMGWCMLPRVMPLVFAILANKEVSGSLDVTRTYLGLWCNNYGDGLVEIDDEGSFAEMAGFNNVRGLRSWRERVEKLAEIGLIKVAPHQSQRIGYVVILRPYAVINEIRRAGKIADGQWNAYVQKVVQVGAVRTDVVVPEELAEGSTAKARALPGAKIQPPRGKVQW